MLNRIWRRFYYPATGGGGGGGGVVPFMTSAALIQKCNLAAAGLSCYVSGGWGQPLTDANKTRLINKNSFNKKHAGLINAQPSNSFAFDCICLIKAILWGWNGDTSDPNGGAVYGSHGVPDIGENTMINRCIGVSTDFSDIVPGEYLWMDGHAGIYIGGGLAVECTTGLGAWGVIKSAVANIGSVAGYPSRRWTKHGKLPWIIYLENRPSERSAEVQDITIEKDGEEMTVSGIYQDGHNYIALSDLTALGYADVSWNAEKRVPIVTTKEEETNG